MVSDSTFMTPGWIADFGTPPSAIRPSWRAPRQGITSGSVEAEADAEALAGALPDAAGAPAGAVVLSSAGAVVLVAVGSAVGSAVSVADVDGDALGVDDSSSSPMPSRLPTPSTTSWRPSRIGLVSSASAEADADAEADGSVPPP